MNDLNKGLSSQPIRALYLRDEHRHPIGMVGLIIDPDINHRIVYTVTYCLPRHKKMQPLGHGIFREVEVGDQFSRRRGWALLRRRFQQHDRLRVLTASPELAVSHVLIDIAQTHRLEVVQQAARRLLGYLADRQQ